MFCKPNDTVIYWRILDFVSGSDVSGNTSTTLPVNTTMLTMNVLASNGALTAANAIQFTNSKIYAETDY
jgi:hypothetical protein